MADFVAGIVPSVKQKNIVAAVRSEEQAKAIVDTGVKAIRLDLSNADAVIDSIQAHDISIVIHLASSLYANLAVNLIDGLSKREEATGKHGHFIHTSGMSAFMAGSGWPADKLNATSDDIFETEKQLADSYPVRSTDVTVIEHAQAKGVDSYIVIPCITHGTGTGAWNQLSVNLPISIRASLDAKQVHRFQEDITASYVHVSDLTALYGRLTEKIIQNEKPPSGQKGYYFSTAYQMSSREFSEQLAAALYTRGLVSSDQPKVWSSLEAAAAGHGVPVEFVHHIWNSGDVASTSGIGKAGEIGWAPQWDKARLFNNINDEIDAVLKLGQAKSSLVDALWATAGRPKPN